MTAATQMIAQGTASQQASALTHFEMRDSWNYVRINGERYVVMASACSGKVYQVRADARGCSCRYYALGHPVCSHMLSVRLDIERRQIIEEQHQAALQAWLDAQDCPDGWTEPTAAEQRAWDNQIERFRQEPDAPRRALVLAGFELCVSAF